MIAETRTLSPGQQVPAWEWKPESIPAEQIMEGKYVSRTGLRGEQLADAQVLADRKPFLRAVPLDAHRKADSPIGIVQPYHRNDPEK